jgi:NADPH:quinone reductase-like Zn-dependent oxidoreductase
VRAVVCDRFGPPEVLRLNYIERPVPRRGEVLVRVLATTMTRTDCDLRHPHRLTGRLGGARTHPKQKIGGRELAGEIEAIGPGVTAFAVGDHVFGMSPDRLGAHAEFVCLPQDAPLAHRPSGVTFEQAAAVCEGAIIALSCLRLAGLESGQRIVIHGAAGSIGTAAVQLARHFGAAVTAVCTAEHAALVTGLGADQVIDYTAEDFTRNGQAYDVIFDAAGHLSFRDCAGSLKPDGRYLDTDLLRRGILDVGALDRLSVVMADRVVADKRVLVPPPPAYTQADVQFVRDLLEAGRYRAVIDRHYPLEQVVEAARYVETGQKTGSVVLTVGGPRHLR